MHQQVTYAIASTGPRSTTQAEDVRTWGRKGATARIRKGKKAMRKREALSTMSKVEWIVALLILAAVAVALALFNYAVPMSG